MKIAYFVGKVNPFSEDDAEIQLQGRALSPLSSFDCGGVPDPQDDNNGKVKPFSNRKTEDVLCHNTFATGDYKR